jgi:branched-chain amino acid transport system ATP-binding protein
MLEVRNIRKSFGAIAAVNDAALRVEQGQLIGLIGPNGSGKSTLLSIIAGSLRADGGQVLIDGADITHLTPDAVFRRGVVRSYQEPSLFFRMTALDNMLLPVREQRGERPMTALRQRAWLPQEHNESQRASGLLRQVGLMEHFAKPASDLSGGQMKLLEMSRSLMGNPRLLLLDEPTAGVAPALAYAIFERIAQLRRDTGLTFLIVEHRLEILFDFVDSLYVMNMGSVIAQGTPAEIAQDALVREVYFGE